MSKKIVFFGFYAVSAILLILYRGPLVRWMESDAYGFQDLYVLLAALLIATVPALPYGIVAAAIGAKYGTLAGAAINIAISSAAALLLFAAIRIAFSERGRERIANVKGIAFLTRLAERDAFMAILFARLLPIVPAQAINIFAAVTKMSWKPYAIATVVGKLPFTLTATLLGDRIFRASDPKGIAVALAVYAAFLAAAYGAYRLYGARKPSA
ncbi:TVP38/TMEM64 family protein [Paenibacillaceae bacterium WGS1546]|uniref:TVP38/TMEM64 family protein n=1 Tax=Cohnella sp. WGS1546 TaxID=3366810 RepID=UPI00372D245F